MNMEIEEKELVGRILKADEKALLYFYRHFQKPLSSFIWKRIADCKDVEEILQDTFLSAIDAFRDFSFRSSLFTFLCSIANHKVVDFYRRKKIKNIVFSRFAEIEPLLSTFWGPEESLDEEILRQKIKHTFKSIEPKYEKILKLKYIYGYSVCEIAGKLSISFKSAESRLFRARRVFALTFVV